MRFLEQLLQSLYVSHARMHVGIDDVGVLPAAKTVKGIRLRVIDETRRILGVPAAQTFFIDRVIFLEVQKCGNNFRISVTEFCFCF